MCGIEPYYCLRELENACTLLSNLYDATEVPRCVFVCVIQQSVVAEQSISQIDKYDTQDDREMRTFRAVKYWRKWLHILILSNGNDIGPLRPFCV